MRREFLGVSVKIRNRRESRLIDVMEARLNYVGSRFGGQVESEISEDLSVMYYLDMIDYEEVETMRRNLSLMSYREGRRKKIDPEDFTVYG